MKPTILFLSDRVPFPPNQPTRLRAFQILRALSHQADIILGAIATDPSDWQYCSMLQEWCKEVKLFQPEHHPSVIKTRAMPFANRHASPNSPIGRWADAMRLQHGISRYFVSGLDMMDQLPEKNSEMQVVLNLSEPESIPKIRKADYVTWPWRRMYLRQAHLTLLREQRAAATADYIVLSPNPDDVDYISMLQTSTPSTVITNGVDCACFNPFRPYKNPYAPHEKVIVFTGRMDYWPNIDAVTWFANEVLPQVRQQIPEAVFYIVGENPSQPVRVLATHPGVKVTGTVSDIRPYLAHAHLAVAPMRHEKKIQSKVLEALSMAVPMIASSKALTGLPLEQRAALWCENNDSAWVQRVLDCLSKPPELSEKESIRTYVEQTFQWDHLLEPVSEFFHFPTLPCETPSA